ncbi:MFS transporter [Paenibacillus terrigena]|uniref:MFS transporter n=1 Tax=Paenibacillus terrigena TaxID=369333 RepID=UPI000378DCC4|nr:MFS transporter [Paenibacillus terrigena]
MLQFLRGNPLFRRYWFGTWFSELGDWIRNMAVMYLVLNLSNNSPIALSWTMFAEYVPIFVLGPIVGVMADRWNRKKTIVWANMCRALMMGVFALAYMVHAIWLLYVAAFLSSICTLFFRAPGSSFTMQFVPEEDRKTAASLRQLSFSVMLMLGPAIGTSLYMFLGPGWVFLLVFTLFMLSAGVTSTIRTAPPEECPGTEAKQGLRSVWDDLTNGMRYAFRHATVRPILFGAVFVGFGAGMIDVLEIFVVTDFLGLPETMMAVLVSVQGISMLVCTLLVQRIKLPFDKFVSYGMIVMGIGLGSMVAYPSLMATAGALVVFSLGQIALNIGMATLMQTKVDYAYQGRVNMTFQTTLIGLMTIALVSTGWLYALLPLRLLVACGGLSIVIGGCVCYMMFRGKAAAVSSMEKGLKPQA